MRLFIACLLILAAGALSASRRARLRIRISFLSSLSDAFALLESDIRALSSPLPLAFERAGTLSPLFREAAPLLFAADAEEAVRRAAATLGVHGEEADILESFARGLLSEDAEGQLANVHRAAVRTTSLSDALSKEEARMGKLYGAGGLLAGLAAVVLLL